MGRISALTELTSLASDDYLVVLDSSANIAKKITIANAFGITDFGWTATGESWTYASWTAATRIGTITVPTDATVKYIAGMRIKITQSTGGTKYGIITKVAATLLTVFFASGTTFNNEAITSPQYSIAKVPLGFNVSPDAWVLELTDQDWTRSSSFLTTWQNLESASLVVPVGAWVIGLSGAFTVRMSSGTEVKAWAGLATTSTGTPESDLIARTSMAHTGATGTLIANTDVYREKAILLTSETTYYLNSKLNSTTNITTISFGEQSGDTNSRGRLFARCAYL